MWVPKWNNRLKKWIEACSLAYNTSQVGGCVGALRWDYDKLPSKSSKWSQLAQPRKEGG
jgi:hypothetical protein